MRCAPSAAATTTWRRSSCATTARSPREPVRLRAHGPPAPAHDGAVRPGHGARDPHGRSAVPGGRRLDRALDLPEGVADLLGGADYGTITGWIRSEIGAV